MGMLLHRRKATVKPLPTATETKAPKVSKPIKRVGTNKKEE